MLVVVDFRSEMLVPSELDEHNFSKIRLGAFKFPGLGLVRLTPEPIFDTMLAYGHESGAHRKAARPWGARKTARLQKRLAAISRHVNPEQVRRCAAPGMRLYPLATEEQLWDIIKGLEQERTQK